MDEALRDVDRENEGHVDDARGDDDRENEAYSGTEQVDDTPLEYKIFENDFNWVNAYQRDPIFQSIYKILHAEERPSEFGYELNGDMLIYSILRGPRICIPAELL